MALLLTKPPVKDLTDYRKIALAILVARHGTIWKELLGLELTKYDFSCYFLPGHSSVAQSSVFVASPTQEAPPLAGAGESQLLEKVSDPPPQVAEHTVSEVHADHPPFTERQTQTAVFSDRICVTCYYLDMLR